jgi:hypothetical protein
MKKIFILIGLIGCMALNAQSFFYEIYPTAKSGYFKKPADTTFYDKTPDGNWFGRYVTVDINVKAMNHMTAKIYPGGYDDRVSTYESVHDFKYFNNAPYSFPLVIDTAAGILIKNRGWWTVKYSFRNFQFQKPAVKIVYGTTDSLKVYILFNAGQL